MPIASRDVAAVQRCYPKIYLACHTRHQRRRSNAAQLTAHESALLAGLTSRERARAIEGLELLAHAAAQLPARRWEMS